MVNLHRTILSKKFTIKLNQSTNKLNGLKLNEIFSPSSAIKSVCIGVYIRPTKA